jgi:transmembrane sensor
MEASERIGELIFRYIRQELTVEEELELTAWVEESPENQRFFEEETDPVNIRKDITAMYHDKDLVYKKILEKHPELSEDRRRFHIPLILKIAVISVLTVGMATLFINLIYFKKGGTVIPDSPVASHSIKAGGPHALLILSNGREVLIDSVDDGQIASEGQSDITKKDSGELVYSDNNSITTGSEAALNTLRTPRGGQFSLRLPDGTRVWLNAASSLTYPSYFTGSERKVTLEGEAYFEVAKNPAAPFKVITQKMQVRVLGTHFNVMAYPDEPVQTATLLEGSVQVKQNNAEVILQPGQQAEVSGPGNMKLIRDADVYAATAWKNGTTSFKDASIQTIMRSISRWYDVDIIYQGQIPDKKFKGGLPRNTDLSELLTVLEQNGIHFTVQGKVITVIP